MERELLPHLAIVAAIAQHGGFARAAAAMQMSPSAVSHALRKVEKHLGQPLFVRTTRSVRLTEAGEALLAVLVPRLEELDEAIEQMRDRHGRISGTLRLNVPRGALPTAITPLLKRMAVEHPDVIVEIVCDDALADIVSEGFDAGVRLGSMLAQDMVALRLTPPFHSIMVATPDYLVQRGMPRRLEDLRAHACIGYRQLRSGGIYDWEVNERGREIAVRVSGPLRITDDLYARDLALHGLGIAYVFEPHVREDLAAGRLLQVLPETAIEEPGFFLYFPERQRQSPKLRALIDVIQREQS